MILQDVIELARYSEAAGTAIKDNNNVIILFINAGLVELYKRFPLNTKEEIISLVDGTTLYDLPADHMYTIAAFEEVEENGSGIVAEIPINDEHSERSIFFPNHKQVQIPLVANDSYISLMYVSKPAQYTVADLAVEVDIPEVLVDCLLHFIGYKAHLGIRGDGQSENNAHFLRFERSCDKARELGIAYSVESLRSADRLFNRGFV